jgi:hypothetical protein
MDSGLENITMINDFHDNPASGEVDFSNWLGGPGPAQWTTWARADREAGARDVVLYWPSPPAGSLDVLRGTSPTVFTKIGTTSGPDYRDVGALDLPDGLLYYKLNGPCP